MKKLWLWRLAVLMLLAVVLLAGCGRKAAEKDDTYQVVVDDLAEIMLAQDRDSAAYDQALDAVRHYLDRPEQQAFDDAMTVLRDTKAYLAQELEEAVVYQADDEMADLLKRQEIDPEEYTVNANMRAMRLSDYISGLEDLQNELDMADLLDNDEALKFWTDYYVRTQNSLRNYAYYTINYWFAGYEEEKLFYVQEKLLDRLESLRTESSIWEDSQDAAERKLNLCLDELETLGQEMEAYIGTVQEEVYKLEQGK